MNIKIQKKRKDKKRKNVLRRELTHQPAKTSKPGNIQTVVCVASEKEHK